MSSSTSSASSNPTTSTGAAGAPTSPPTEEETWTLQLNSNKTGKTNTILWKGKKGTGPSIKELSTKLKLFIDWDSPCAEELLTDITSQILRNCPSKLIPTLLSALSCHFYRNPSTKEIDIHLLQSLPSNTQHNNVCGVVFKKGDLAWVCRTCGKDQVVIPYTFYYILSIYAYSFDLSYSLFHYCL